MYAYFPKLILTLLIFVILITKSHTYFKFWNVLIIVEVIFFFGHAFFCDLPDHDLYPKFFYWVSVFFSYCFVNSYLHFRNITLLLIINIAETLFQFLVYILILFMTLLFAL